MLTLNSSHRPFSRVVAVLGFGLLACLAQPTVTSAALLSNASGALAKERFHFPSQAEVAVLRLDDAGQNVVILVAGVVAYQRPLANISELTIEGNARDNTLSVDFSFGNPIPIGGLNYNGGDQETITGDALEMIGAGPTSTRYVPTVLAAGILELSSGKEGTPTSVIRFTGLEPIIDTVVTASLTVNSTDGSNTISLTNGTAPRLTVTVDAFESIEFNNKTSLVVNAGNGIAGSDAGDTFNVNFSNTPAALTSITLNGDEGDDTFNLLQTAAVSSLTINGGSGTNTVHPGGMNPGSFTPGAFTLNSATLEVNLSGTTAGIGYDQIQTPAVTLTGSTLSVNVNTTLSSSDQFRIIDNTGGAAVSGSFTGLAEGTVFAAGGRNLRISYSGGTGNDVVLTVEKINQTLTFNAAPSVVVGGTGTVSLSAQGASGNAIAWSSTTATQCTVDPSTGVVTGIHAGTNNCTIRADQAGNTDYNAGQATQTFSIGKGSQALTFNAAPSVVVGGTGTVSLSAQGASGNAIAWSSTTATQCTVDPSTGVVTGIHAGTNNCTIRADQAGNTDYNAGQATQTFSITPVVSVTGASPTGTGNITASFTGGGPNCSFTAQQFIPMTGNGTTPQPSNPAAKVYFPQGFFAFTVRDCTPGDVLNFTITYPQALPPNTTYWKYGPSQTDATPHWYVLPAVFSGSTVTFSITDGGLGDHDLPANGTIVDPGGPVTTVEPIPTLSGWVLALLSLVLLGIGARRMQRNH